VAIPSRRRALTVVAVVIVVCELWAASTRIGHLAAKGARALDGPNPTVQAADLDPLAFYASPEALVRARSVIPPNATFSVVVPGGNENGAILAFKFALLPRVYTPDRHKAQWVIAYQVPSEGLGVRYSREIGLSPDANVVEVER
jgi:hypothetical protein